MTNKGNSLPSEAILTWRLLQKKHTVPVNALGQPIDPGDEQALHHWKKSGIHHYLDRADLKRFQKSITQKEPSNPWFFSRYAMILVGVVFFILLSFNPARLDSPVYQSPTGDPEVIAIFKKYLTTDVIFPRQDRPDPEFWEYPTLAIASHLTKRELDLYERHQPYRKTFRQIAELTRLDAHYFAALFYAESDLTHHLTTRSGKTKIVKSNKNALGISQVTRGALDHLDREIEFYRDVYAKREDINRTYLITGDLNLVGEMAQEVGIHFISAALTQSGVSNEELTSANLTHRRDPLYLNFRGLNTSSDLCAEIGRRLDVLNILVGKKVDHKLLQQDADYAMKVGAAYFYLDYLALKSAFPKYKDKTIVEMSVNSYNAGRGAVIKLVKKYGADWRKHRHPETQIHWNRFSRTWQQLHEIEKKLTIETETKGK